MADQVSKRLYTFHMTTAVIEISKENQKTLIVREKGEKKHSETIWKMGRQDRKSVV